MNTNKKDLNNIVDYKDIKEIIYFCKEEYGEKTAFVIKHKYGNDVDYENISYSRLLDDINKLGTAFYSLGLKDKKVAVIGKNRYEWIISHLANLLGGIVSVPLDKDLQIGELESSLIRSGVEAIVFDKKQIEKINAIKEKNSTNVKHFICMDNVDEFENVSELMLKGERIINSGNTEYIDTKIDENSMGILLFTSGTTSRSKAVMLSQRNIASNVYGMRCAEDIRTTDTNILFLPLHHIFGSTLLIMALASGVKNVFPDGLKYIKKNLKEYKVTVFIGVPVLNEAIYKAVKKEMEKQGKLPQVEIALKICDFLHLGNSLRRIIFKQVIEGVGGHLRLVISGGAPADKKILKAFNDFGVNTLQGYGLTETSPVVAVESDIYRKNGTVGKPLLNEKIEIVNKDENGIGEIKVKGPNIMLGYYDMEEETKRVLKDGWFYTGDLGYLDEEGFLVINGRNKNMIVLKNGKKVFPEEIETVVNRIDGVQECMVFGMPENDNVNDVTLSVKVVYDKKYVKENYGNLSEDELFDLFWKKIKDVNLTFPKYKHIKKLILTDEELIKTTTKKVKRQEEMKRIINENK